MSININNTASASSSGGIGILGAMFLIFLTLKLLGYIDWSWIWVTAPLWGGLLLAIVVVALYFLIARGVVSFVIWREKKK